jgi:CheY-like chemotaxis protein
LRQVLIERENTEYPDGIEETRRLLEREVPASLRETFLAALASSDLRRSRQILIHAADAGWSLARLYTDVVRPALRTAAYEPSLTAAQRLTLTSVEAALAVVASRPADGEAMRGAGRKALVSVGAAPLDVLDGQVIIDVLCGDGWSVEEVATGTDAQAVAAMALHRHGEPVGMPTSNAADLLQAASTYTQLRRLADPPIIVACSFGRPDETRRARAAGADIFVSDPDDLIAFVRRRLPTAGARNWGVRLRRFGETFIVAPTGDLDAGSVARLRQVVDSRAGSFRSLVVDTRDVASVRGDGVEALLAWISGTMPGADGGRSSRVLPGPLFKAALAGLAIDGALIAAPADAG